MPLQVSKSWDDEFRIPTSPVTLEGFFQNVASSRAGVSEVARGASRGHGAAECYQQPSASRTSLPGEQLQKAAALISLYHHISGITELRGKSITPDDMFYSGLHSS